MAGKLDIGPRIGIDGEAEYRKELSNIIQQTKTLQAEMKAVTSSFTAETSAEEKSAAQRKILTQEIEAQNKKIELMKSRYEEAAKAFGENDTKTLKYKESLNKATAELNSMEKQLSDVENAANDAGEEFDDAGDKTSRFGDVLKANLASEAITGSVKALGAAIKGIANAAADGVKEIASALNETATAGDEIDKFSQKLGMSAEAYQKWDYTLGLSGVEVTSMTTGMKTLTNQIDNAKNGTSGAAEKFAALGISMDQLKELSREDIFAAVVTGFQGMADSTERAALANDLFGKSGQELAPLFNTTAEETAEAMRAAEELGFVMSNEAVAASAAYKDSLDTLQRTFNGLKNNLAAEFLPSVTTVMDGFTMVLSGNVEEGAAMIEQGIEDFAEQAKELGPIAEEMLDLFVDTVVDMLPEVLNAAGDVVISLCDGIVKMIPSLIPVAVDVINKICDFLVDNFDLLVDVGIDTIVSLALGLSEGLPKIIARLPEIVTAIIKGLSKMLLAVPEIGENLIKGLWNGIGNMKEWIISKIRGFGNNIVSSLKDFFGIHSPSTVMEKEVGKFLGLGLLKGYADSMRSAAAEIKEITQKAFDIKNDVAEAMKFSADDILKMAVGLKNVDLAADLNGDGVVNSLDARIAMRSSEGLSADTVNKTTHQAVRDVTVIVNPSKGMDETVLADKVISRLNTKIRIAQGAF